MLLIKTYLNHSSFSDADDTLADTLCEFFITLRGIKRIVGLESLFSPRTPSRTATIPDEVIILRIITDDKDDNYTVATEKLVHREVDRQGNKRTVSI